MHVPTHLSSSAAPTPFSTECSFHQSGVGFFHIKIHALTLSYLIVNKLQQMPQQNFAMERTVYNEEFFFYYIPRYPHREISGDLPIAEKTGPTRLKSASLIIILIM